MLALACGDDAQPAATGGTFDASAHDAAHPMNDASSVDATPIDSSVDSGPVRDVAFGVDTSNALVRFSVIAPSSITKSAITGLQTSETIVGIDVRPSNGFSMDAARHGPRQSRDSKSTDGGVLIGAIGGAALRAFALTP